MSYAKPLNLDKIKDWFRNKRVVLVGNSVEIMNHAMGDYIDSHDIVVRFGRGIEASGAEEIAVGKKLDVWVIGEFRSHMVNLPYVQNILDKHDPLILYNRNRINLKSDINIPELVKGVPFLFSDEEHLAINARYGIKNNVKMAPRLSAGTTTIIYFCEKIKTYSELNIVGFDFFAKSSSKRRGGGADPASWHLPISSVPEETHKYKIEIEIVNHYVSMGALNWKILTNLEPEDIINTKYGRF